MSVATVRSRHPAMHLPDCAFLVALLALGVPYLLAVAAEVERLRFGEGWRGPPPARGLPWIP